MDTLAFFQAILPPTGSYYLATISKPKRSGKRFSQTIHYAYSSLEDLAVGVEKHSANTSVNLFHACGSYLAESVVVNGNKSYRKQENWAEAKALWIDLDCGQEKFDSGAGYIDLDSARAGILEFCTVANFPTPMIVNSGNGVHCYWPFTSPIPAVKWLALARVFKQVLSHHKVMADDSCTADFARILRPVGSFNNKSDTAKAVTCELEAELISPSLILERLKALALDANIKPEVRCNYSPSFNSDLMVPVVQIPTYAEEVAKHCNQIKKVAETQGDVSRPLWFAAIGLTTFCEEGIEAAEKWTEKRGQTGHADTDYQTRYNSWDANPPSCAKFEADNPKGCAGCPHKGKINTPLVLGRASKAMQTIAEVEQALEEVERPPLFLPDKNGNGRPLSTTANVQAVLNLEGVTTRYNQMTKDLEVIVPGVNSVPDETSNSNQTAAIDLLAKYGVPYARAQEQINAIAASNPYCPVRQMIESKPWDGISRLNSFMAQLDTPHPQEANLYFRKWLIQAVAAVYLAEGLSAAGLLALTGPQGIGKTRLIRQLASRVPKGFLEGATLDPSNKDSVMTIASHWIVELGELDATFRKSDLAQLKAFITKKVDKFRRPYAKKDSEFPRRTVMAGTVNDTEFLYDNTGNRRFWVVQVNAVHVDSSLDMQQLWAEVKTWYDGGETWHFNQQEQLSLNQHNSQFEVVDPIKEKLLSRFNFQDWTKASWITATRIAEIAFIDRPSMGDLQRISTSVRKLNGGQARCSGGRRLLLVPGDHK